MTDGFVLENKSPQLASHNLRKKDGFRIDSWKVSCSTNKTRLELYEKRYVISF